LAVTQMMAGFADLGKTRRALIYPEPCEAQKVARRPDRPLQERTPLQRSKAENRLILGIVLFHGGKPGEGKVLRKGAVGCSAETCQKEEEDEPTQQALRFDELTNHDIAL